MYAAGALWNLAASSEALERRFAEAGALEALLQPMALHREVAAVQVNAAGALGIWPSALLLRSSGSPTQEPWRHCSRPWPCIEK